MNNTWKYVAWKRKTLHDVSLDDVIGGHQAYIHRKKDLFMAHRILHRAKTTRGSRDARGLCVRRDYKIASLAAASFVKLSNFQNILILPPLSQTRRKKFF